MANKILDIAKRAKADEFYTQLVDIEKELKYYTEQLRGKIVYCNCDDPYESNFFKYFVMNFNSLGLKKLIATCYKNSELNKTTKAALKIVITEVNECEKSEPPDIDWLLKSEKNVLTQLKGDGDFRSKECIELLKESDIVVTNPPFSLFREYIAQLMEYEKKFLIIGNVNAITYKEISPLIKENKIWLGESIHSGDREFRVPECYQIRTKNHRIDKEGIKYVRVTGVRWFTNLGVPTRNKKLILHKKYNPEEYPKYDNYDAIEVSKTKDIPCDYEGAMGVPITFMDKYNPEQFELIRFGKGDDGECLSVNGKFPYFRIIIRRKTQEKAIKINA